MWLTVGGTLIVLKILIAVAIHAPHALAIVKDTLTKAEAAGSTIDQAKAVADGAEELAREIRSAL